MIEVEVVEIAPGQFAVVAPGHYQAHDPDLPGFVPMTEARAGEVANALRAVLSAV